MCILWPVVEAGHMAAKDAIEDEEVLVERMSLLNPWWAAGTVPARLVKEFRRRDHAALSRHMDKPEAQTILGARRVGKTTICTSLPLTLSRPAPIRAAYCFCP